MCICAQNTCIRIYMCTMTCKGKRMCETNVDSPTYVRFHVHTCYTTGICVHDHMNVRTYVYRFLFPWKPYFRKSTCTHICTVTHMIWLFVSETYIYTCKSTHTAHIQTHVYGSIPSRLCLGCVLENETHTRTCTRIPIYVYLYFHTYTHRST